MEGTRIATVGVATFTVSLFAALWVIMCLVGRLTRQTWMYTTGGIMLGIVVIIFAVAPREPAIKDVSGTTTDTSTIIYSNYYSSTVTVAVILIVSTLASCFTLVIYELPTLHRAKRVDTINGAASL